MKLLNYFLISLMITSGSIAFAENISNPGFAIKNDSKQPVWFTLVSGQNQVGNVERLNPGQDISRAIPDLNFLTYLVIWKKDPKNFQLLKSRKGFDDKERPITIDKWGIYQAVQPKADFIYTFTKGNTIYVILDKNNKLVPQSKSFFSSAKYPLDNNVKGEKDIVLLFIAQEDKPNKYYKNEGE